MSDCRTGYTKISASHEMTTGCFVSVTLDYDDRECFVTLSDRVQEVEIVLRTSDARKLLAGLDEALGRN